MFARRSHLVGLQCLVHDLGLTMLAFPVAYLLRSHVLPRVWHGLGPVYPLRAYGPLALAIFVLWPVIGYSLRTYQQINLRSRFQLARDAATLVLVGSIFAFAALYLMRAEYVSRSFVLVFAAVDAIALILGRWLFFSAGAWFRDRLERYRFFLIVGTGPAARELAGFIQQGSAHGHRLVGFVHTDDEPVPPDLAAYRVFPVASVPEIIENEPVDEIIFAVNRTELGALEPLMLRCQEEGIHTRVHLDFLPLTVSRVYLENLRDVPLLTFASTPDNELLLFLKRAADVVLAVAGLVILAPLMLVISLLVRFTSPGRIFYTQIRSGLGGRRFTLYKFRSMVADADKMRLELEHRNEVEGPVFKMTKDPRCTPVGRWLRRFSLDELPQLWNIVRGDMSFVGPRPPLPEEVAQYATWQRRRLRMRPGLTCLWAVEGRSQIRFERWMQLDLAYIDNWSLWLDLKIFLKTIPHVLRGRGAC
jgi:exopolysaccharide biosynthesis polyprenyl glycosylphosphotransferase